MPKIIENVEGKLIEAGRKTLFEDGYRAFTMRTVAARCGIGLGTAYNYFDSKELLTAQIILQDWENAKAAMQEKLDAVDTPEEKAKVLYEQILSFNSMYKKVWSQYAGMSHAANSVSDYHEKYMKQLCEMSGLEMFVAEVINHFATVADMAYEEIEPYINKLLK